MISSHRPSAEIKYAMITGNVKNKANRALVTKISIFKLNAPRAWLDSSELTASSQRMSAILAAMKTRNAVKSLLLRTVTVNPGFISSKKAVFHNSTAIRKIAMITEFAF